MKTPIYFLNSGGGGGGRFWSSPFSTIGRIRTGSPRHHPRYHPHFSLAFGARCLIVSSFSLFVLANLLVANIRELRMVNQAVNVDSLRKTSWVNAASQPFNQRGVAQAATHLIIVAGHSVTVSGHLEDADGDERDWFLLDYQKHTGLPQAIVRHIRAGIQAAEEDPQSLLVLSGGETRSQTGPDSEGTSYYRVIDAMNLWPAIPPVSSKTSPSTVRARTLSEEFATDSMQNLHRDRGHSLTLHWLIRLPSNVFLQCHHHGSVYSPFAAFMKSPAATLKK